MSNRPVANLPDDLVRFLIGYCPTKPWSLALVNKHYNHYVTPILYEDVDIYTLRGTRGLSSTMKTGRPHLRNYLKALTVSTLLDPSADHEALNRHLRDLLLLTPNLSKLSVLLPAAVTRYLIEEPRYPFSLRYLCMTADSSEKFLGFLRSQNQIESICLWKESRASIAPSQHQSAVFLSQPDLLPHLQSIESTGFWIQSLVPSRPVSRVGCDRSDCIERLSELRIINCALSQSSASLTYLSIGLLTHVQIWHMEILELLSDIQFCCKSLSELSLRFSIDYVRRMRREVSWILEPRYTPSDAFLLVRERLAMFSSLKKFGLDPPYNWGREISSDVLNSFPEFSGIGLWKESCNTLEEVRLFGTAPLRSRCNASSRV
ncbi:hypothetical protein FRC12_019186 [Ceratobasidium sp. 428]|nr:hypothetical protein FRC12_019186 [Ceratobasidium sp. 428]